jgi:hypothetical protein
MFTLNFTPIQLLKIGNFFVVRVLKFKMTFRKQDSANLSMGPIEKDFYLRMEGESNL